MYSVVYNQKINVFQPTVNYFITFTEENHHVFVLMFAEEIQRRAFSKLFFYVKITNCTVFCYEML